MSQELDGVDAHPITLSLADARYTATDLAEEIGVSDNTIIDRMGRLEASGVIDGYTADIEPRRVGFQFYYHFTCPTPSSDRAELAEQVILSPEVVAVTELMTGQEKLHAQLVGKTDEDITRMAEKVDELNLEITDENLIRAEHTGPIEIGAFLQTD